jgi:N-acetylglucosamine-6-phosphate deacetylase
MPSASTIDALMDGYEEMVRILTISPELPGAISIIERCAALDIRASMGHSEATYAEALDGKRAGARGVTHLFNAMRPFHHREPGLVGLALLDDEMYVEVIADGLHLAPETLRMVFRMKPRGRIIAVSDSVAGPGEVGGVLQGSEAMLPEIAARLRAIGIADEDVAEAVGPSALRYLGIERLPGM